MKNGRNILYSVLAYSIAIAGAVWLFYIAVNDYNQSVIEHRKTDDHLPLTTQLITASKLKALGKTDAAEVILTGFVEENPANYEGRMMLSELYFESCIKDTLNCDLALWNLTFLVQKFPDKSQPYLYRSDVYMKLGDTVAALNDLAKANGL